MKKVYELKQFKDSRNKDLAKALIIYSKNIEPFLRTDTREIIHWIDEYPLQHDDTFIVFGLYLNSIIVGYAQLAYFKEERLIFVDYIVIEEEYRKNNTFYVFLDEIKEFLTNEKFEFDFVLAEIGGFDNKEPSTPTKNLIRLLKMSQFGVIKTTYYHPRLGKINYESELQSILMMYSKGDLKFIKKDTYLLFLNTIYFKHYKRWYDAFFDDKERAEYSNSLINLLEKSKTILKKKETIEVNGYISLFATKTPLNNPVSNYKKLAKVLAVIVLFTALSVLFGIIHLIVKNRYKIETSAQVYIVLAAAFSLLLFLLLFNEKRNHSVTDVVEKILLSLRK